MLAFRIADARHPLFDPTGAMLHGGRWNSPGARVIYAAETFSGALLEILVHSNLSAPPRNHRSITITIPASVSVETVDAASVPGWNAADMLASRRFGDLWYQQQRSAVLRVPGVVQNGHECNLVLNSTHPQFALITVSAPNAIVWDQRLF